MTERKFITSNSLTLTSNGGKIKTVSDVMQLEYQRYGRNKTTLVNKTYIESGEYRRKFDNATDNPDINKMLYDKSKEALKHRSGTVFEDMYWIDSESGKLLLEVTDSIIERAIVYNKKVKKFVREHKNNIITLHTHPSSMPPSAGDFNSCFINGYKQGFVSCHDGMVFAYTSNQIINENLYKLYIASYIKEGYSEFDAQFKTVEKLKENHDIDLWEVK